MSSLSHALQSAGACQEAIPPLVRPVALPRLLGSVETSQNSSGGELALDQLVGVCQGLRGAGVRPEAGQLAVAQPALLQVAAVDVRDLQLTTGAGPQGVDYREHVGRIQVDPSHGQVAFRLCRLFLDPDDSAVANLGHAVTLGIGHPLQQDPRMFRPRYGIATQVARSAEKGVVAEKGERMATTTEDLGQTERLRDAARRLLDAVGQVAVVAPSRAEKRPESTQVLRTCHQQDLVDPGADDLAERVANHRRWADRQQVLVGCPCQLTQPATFCSRQDYAADVHGVSSILARFGLNPEST